MKVGQKFKFKNNQALYVVTDINSDYTGTHISYSRYLDKTHRILTLNYREFRYLIDNTYIDEKDNTINIYVGMLFKQNHNIYKVIALGSYDVTYQLQDNPNATYYIKYNVFIDYFNSKEYEVIDKKDNEYNSVNDSDFLKWIYDRMVHVHNENPNSDYMLRFKDIIK